MTIPAYLRWRGKRALRNGNLSGALHHYSAAGDLIGVARVGEALLVKGDISGAITVFKHARRPDRLVEIGTSCLSCGDVEHSYQAFQTADCRARLREFKLFAEDIACPACKGA